LGKTNAPTIGLDGKAPPSTPQTKAHLSRAFAKIPDDYHKVALRGVERRKWG
jgi:hypothetical protein